MRWFFWQHMYNFERYNLICIMSILILVDGGYYVIEYLNKWRVVSLSLWISFVRIFNIFIIVFLLRTMLVVFWLSYMKYGAVFIYTQINPKEFSEYVTCIRSYMSAHSA